MNVFRGSYMLNCKRLEIHTDNKRYLVQETDRGLLVRDIEVVKGNMQMQPHGRNAILLRDK